MPLVADEAWGAHLHFSSALPAAALECGADVVLSSVHKLVGSITQSAILHLGDCGDRIDERVVDRAVTLIETTSPNAILTASLDAARRQAAVHGEELLAETVASLAELRERIRAIPGLDVLDERIVGRAGVHAYDPLRLVVDVRGIGATGHRIARLMREQDDINLELFSENVVVAVFGIGERAARTGERLVSRARARRRADRRGGRGAAAAVRRAAAVGADASSRRATPSSPRRRWSSSTVPRAGSPPSRWPPTRPGSRTCCRASVLTRPTLDYIADSVAHGGLVRGASDRTLRTVRVVAG